MIKTSPPIIGPTIIPTEGETAPTSVVSDAGDGNGAGVGLPGADAPSAPAMVAVSKFTPCCLMVDLNTQPPPVIGTIEFITDCAIDCNIEFSNVEDVEGGKR